MIQKNLKEEFSGSLTPELEGSPRSRIHESRIAAQNSPGSVPSEPSRLNGSQLQQNPGTETGC